MSAPEVTVALVDAIKSQKFDYITLNFANGDMVGHTGVYEAIEKAVKTIDEVVNYIKAHSVLHYGDDEAVHNY